MRFRRFLRVTTLTAAVALGSAAPAYAASVDFASVTGESPSTLTPCVMASLSQSGITSEQMLTDLLASGPRTRDAVANQLRAVEASCASLAGSDSE